MGVINLPGQFLHQPQGMVRPSSHGLGNNLVVAALPAVCWTTGFYDAVTGEQLGTATAGTVSTYNQPDITKKGKAFRIHPSGGANGVTGWQYPYSVCDVNNDFTAHFGGYFLGSLPSNSGCFHYGGASDGIRVYLTSTTNMRFAWIDSSPAQFNLDVTIPTVASGDYIEVIITKRGTTRELYVLTSDGTISYGTQSTGLSTARKDGSTGWQLGNYSGSLFYGKVISANLWERKLERQDVLALIQNPSILYEAENDYIYVAASGGGTTATPSAGNNVINGLSPSIQSEKIYNPVVGSNFIQGQVPTITTQAAAYNASPSVGNNTIQGLTPSVGLEKTYSPSVGNNINQGLIPTIDFGNTFNASPVVGNNIINGLIPSVGQEKTFSPSVGSNIINGLAPGVTWELTITPFTGNISNYGLVPTVSAGATTSFTASPTTGMVYNYGMVPLVQTGLWTAKQKVTSFWSANSDGTGTWTAQTPASTTWTN